MRKKYSTDLMDEQWNEIALWFVGMTKYKWEKRELVYAVLYLVDSGCKWRQLPHDFPPPFTVHSFYRRARLSGLCDKILEHMEKVTRKNAELVRQLHSSILKVFRTPKLVNNPALMQEKKKGIKRQIATDKIGCVVTHKANRNDTKIGIWVATLRFLSIRR